MTGAEAREKAVRQAIKMMGLIRASAPEAANAHILLGTLVRKHSLEWDEYGAEPAAADPFAARPRESAVTWGRKSSKNKRKFRG